MGTPAVVVHHDATEDPEQDADALLARTRAHAEKLSRDPDFQERVRAAAEAMTADDPPENISCEDLRKVLRVSD